MDFRSFLNDLDQENKLVHVTDEISHEFEIARKLKESASALLFEEVRGKEMKVAGNIFGSRDRVAMGLGVNRAQLIDEMRKSLLNPKPPGMISEAPVQEVIEEDINLRELPIIKHYEKDGGPYVTAGIIVTEAQDGNRNLSFHRLQLIEDDKFAVRLVPRDLHQIFKESEEEGRSLDIAAVLGGGIGLALAAATSASYEVDEYEIAGALSEDLELTKCHSLGLEIPARAEIVMEGKLLAGERAPEGPFTDVTGTYDVIRQQPVFQVDCITRREDAIYPSILPGGPEHQLLMGMPREPIIFEETEKVADIEDVALTPGGCGWLHAVMSINKRDEEDGIKAIEAAFKAHSSLKHVVVVDSDIDIYDSEEVEWAIATRFRSDRDVVIKSNVEGSSLDPTADPATELGSKMGIDATKDLDNLDKFERAQIPRKRGVAMNLTKAQEKMLSGEKGDAVQKAMEILTGLGDIYEAEKFISVKSAHVSGISIRTAGNAGLNFIEEMVEMGAEVSVPTTINPAAFDLRDWEDLGIPEEISEKQIRIIEAYKKMGADPVCSCIPYLIGNEPSSGQHVVWSESSAVIYANSVLGARTNREGAPSALASAVTGLTPDYGYHLDENRTGSVRIRPDPDLFAGEGTFSFSVLGYWVGDNFPESVPVIENLHPNLEQQKALGAGMATSGAIALYHLPHVTPEAKENPEVCETDNGANFEFDEFEKIRSELDQTSEEDIICLGCPHASKEELRRLSEMDVEKEVWVHVPRKLRESPDMKEIYRRLKEKNVKFVCDTCMVVSPLSEMGYSSIGVNSAKAAYYAPLLGDVKVHFAPLEELIK